MKNDDKDILNFMNNELRVGLKFMSERDVIIMENQHEKLQYELSNAKREFAKRSSKVVNISDRLK